MKTSARLPALAPRRHLLCDHEFPILPETITVRYQGTRSKQCLSFKRTQLPVIPAFAMTAHKSLGQTLEKAIVDLTNCHGTESPYVMLSRVRRLNDLLILRPFPMSKIKCRMSEDTRREQTRLRYHHFMTVRRHGSLTDQQNATTEIASLKHNLSQHQLDDILGTNFIEPQSASPPDPRPPKRRKVRQITLNVASTC